MKLARRWFVAMALPLVLTVSAPECGAAQDDSVIDKIKHLFVKPTPTPTPKPRKKRTKKKSSPTPSPTPSASAAAAATASPAPSESAPIVPAATASPAASATATATPAAAATVPPPSPSPTGSPLPRHGRSQHLEPVRPIAPGPHAKFRTSVSPPPEASPPAIRTPLPLTSPVSAATASPLPAATASRAATPAAKSTHAPNATISPDEISGYESYPAEVRHVLDSALALTTQNLGYKYGSADPANGGMDCSGFIYYVVSQCGIKDAPRDAREQYIWVRKAGNFQAVLAHRDDTFELDALKPGDLLFWAGTYNVSRDPAITHTMIYLGREKGTNQRVMVGASDGRTYRGQQRFGVSVFDFK
ncbi:MAG TPA: NlpC/P60 family protein, partial [Chthoniobacterales bacterium]|nr:NlpC/P60 family protein [Chthoniobacterales bacterium]